jgi:hypothetical protein
MEFIKRIIALLICNAIALLCGHIVPPASTYSRNYAANLVAYCEVIDGLNVGSGPTSVLVFYLCRSRLESSAQVFTTGVLR